MSHFAPAPKKSDEHQELMHTHPRHKGFIVFCETNLRYEKGFKAWIFLGPYLLGALGLEVLITSGLQKSDAALVPWIGFLIYLMVFPSIWRRTLKFIARGKAVPVTSGSSSAVELQ